MPNDPFDRMRRGDIKYMWHTKMLEDPTWIVGLKTFVEKHGGNTDDYWNKTFSDEYLRKWKVHHDGEFGFTRVSLTLILNFEIHSLTDFTSKLSLFLFACDAAFYTENQRTSCCLDSAITEPMV